MEFVHEVTAYLENKPGRLAKICSALAHEKINIRALSVMDTADRSVLRLVTDDLEPTKRVLTSLGTEFEVGEVLVGPDGEPPRGAGQGPGAARRGAHQHRIRLRLGSSTEPGRSLGIFHTSNPQDRSASRSLSDSTRRTAIDRLS